MDVSFLQTHARCAQQLWFARYTVSRKACFTGHCTGNHAIAAEKTIFTRKNDLETYRSVIWPGRPPNGHDVVVIQAFLVVRTPTGSSTPVLLCR